MDQADWSEILDLVKFVNEMNWFIWKFEFVNKINRLIENFELVYGL